MIHVQLIVSLFFLAISGFFAVSVLLRDRGQSGTELFVRIWLGIGAGFGLTSLNYFLWRLFSDPDTRAFLIGEVFLFATLTVLYLRTGRFSGDLTVLAGLLRLRRPPVLGTIFWFISGIAMGMHGLVFLKIPQGGWDAWMIWNLHARFMVRGGTSWQNVFSPLLPHPDYPMLIPASVARAWSLLGNETVYAPAMIGGMFAFGILGLLVSGLWQLRGRNLGYLAGLLLLGASAFHVHGPTQASDFPMAYFILGAVLLVFLYERDPVHGERYLVLSGAFAALTAWTKNEGFLFILAFLLSRAAVMLLNRKGADLRTEARAVLTGLAPILLTVLAYKAIFAPANDLIEAQGMATLDRLTDWPRYWTIGREFLFQTVRLDARSSIPFAGLLVLVLILGPARIATGRTGAITALLISAIMIGGYYLVFVLTYFEVEWHLYTANVRLFFHVWPITVLAASMLVDGSILEDDETAPELS